MADELKVGDVVRLKSGGPAMTIENIDTYGKGKGATCTWFDGSKRVTEMFMLAVLDKEG